MKKQAIQALNKEEEYMKVFDKVKEYILMQLPVSGDKVTMEMSPYDLTKARITWRSK